jgi:dihydropteroate synthase
MAIINRTRDSFYDHVATFDEGAAMAAVDRAVADGAEGARVFRAHQVPETRKVLAMVAQHRGHPTAGQSSSRARMKTSSMTDHC